MRLSAKRTDLFLKAAVVTFRLHGQKTTKKNDIVDNFYRVCRVLDKIHSNGEGFFVQAFSENHNQQHFKLLLAIDSMRMFGRHNNNRFTFMQLVRPPSMVTWTTPSWQVTHASAPDSWVLDLLALVEGKQPLDGLAHKPRSPFANAATISGVCSSKVRSGSKITGFAT